LDHYADINTLPACRQGLISMENEPFADVNEKSKREKEEETEKRKERQKRWEMWSAPRMREIVPGLILGNVQASYNRELLRENHIKLIVSLTDSRYGRWGVNTREEGIPLHRHKWVQCADSSTQNLLFYMSDICNFIDRMASPALQASSTFPPQNEPGTSVQPNTELDPGPNVKQDSGCEPDQLNQVRPEAVLIHCDMGRSRAPTVIAAYLMRKYRAKREDVLAFVQAKQKIKISATFTRQLQIWEHTGYQIWVTERSQVPKGPYQEYLDDRDALLEAKGLTGYESLSPRTLENGRTGLEPISRRSLENFRPIDEDPEIQYRASSAYRSYLGSWLY
jgi:dual specificity phosphatase 12